MMNLFIPNVVINLIFICHSSSQTFTYLNLLKRFTISKKPTLLLIKLLYIYYHYFNETKSRDSSV